MVFLAGALTEVRGEPGSPMQARLADPTGVTAILVPAGQRSIADALSHLSPPVFATVTGEISSSSHPRASPAGVRPDSIRQVDRTVRDSWIIRTAELTLLRLRARAGERGTHSGDLSLLAGEVLSALGTVHPVPGGEDAGSCGPDAREAVIAVLEADRGKGGVAVEDIIAATGASGLSREAVLRTLAELVREDEVYQPSKGRVRLL